MSVALEILCGNFSKLERIDIKTYSSMMLECLCLESEVLIDDFWALMSRNVHFVSDTIVSNNQMLVFGTQAAFDQIWTDYESLQAMSL